MNHKSTVELKGIARDKLLGNYGTVIGAIVTVQLIFFGINSIVRYVSDLNSITGMIVYIAITLICSLIASVFVVGELTIYMKLACGDSIKITDVFSAFTGHPDKVIILDLIVSLRVLVWLIPAAATLCYMYLKDSYGNVLILLASGLMIIGLIGSIYTYIRLSQCLFIFLDFPDLTVNEIIERSIGMMEGQYGRFLYMMISFIPIYLLGILSLGIGFIFIQPYKGMTYTEFYLTIAAQPVKDLGSGFDMLA